MSNIKSARARDQYTKAYRAFRNGKLTLEYANTRVIYYWIVDGEKLRLPYVLAAYNSYHA